jgi:hypothetical protein
VALVAVNVASVLPSVATALTVASVRPSAAHRVVDHQPQERFINHGE